MKLLIMLRVGLAHFDEEIMINLLMGLMVESGGQKGGYTSWRLRRCVDWLLGEIEGGAGNDPFLLSSPPS